MKLPNLKLSVMTNISIKRFWKGKWLNLSVFLTTFLLINYFHFSPFLWQLGNHNSSVAFAQTIAPEKVSQEVYQQIPDFPSENNYTSVSNGQRSIENTLISRMVRYHQYIKVRPTNYRLDWKLTLADYLRKNEIIDEQRYPGNGTLTQNPLEFDRAIIEKLTMRQREELVDVLVSIYKPTTETQKETKPSPSPTPDTPPTGIILPQPGSADLLLPQR